MLELSGVRYQPATAVRPRSMALNLQLAQGQLGLVVGRSGSGKTTLLEVISGLAEPERGGSAGTASCSAAASAAGSAAWCSSSPNAISSA